MDRDYRFDDIDMEQIRLRLNLSPRKRIQVLLDAREVAVNFMRSRLRQQYPNLPKRELNLKVLEEIERAKNRTYPRF